MDRKCGSEIDGFFQRIRRGQWRHACLTCAFEIEDALATPNAAEPQLSFKARITNAELEPIHSIALRVQVRIETVRAGAIPPSSRNV